MADDLPEVDLRHLLDLTDDTGILQHSTFATPNPWHGYCTDDNARALIAAVTYAHLFGQDRCRIPLKRYLSFLAYAFDSSTRRFRNFMDYDRRWREEVGSEDSHARAAWALGLAVRRAPLESVREMANRLFHDALLAVDGFGHARPWAYSVLGVDEYLRTGREDGWVAELRERLAGRLFDAWRDYATEEWPWWEDELTWGNAKLAHALITSGEALCREDMMDGGLRTLRWLLDVQTAEDGHLSIVGNDGWYVRGGKRARFDQQPLEAYALLEACLAAAEATGEGRWVGEARRCFEWFLGKNDLGVPLVDPETGGCRDGLNLQGVNANQGAESTLAYVLSLLGLHLNRSEGKTATESG
jgi:hypothetical protein